MPPKDTDQPDQTDVGAFMLNKYNKLDKAAFDVQDDIDISKRFKKAESFGAGRQDIMKDAGLKSDALKQMAGTAVGSDEWMDAFRGAAETSTDYAVDTMLAGALQAIFPEAPGVGAVVSAVWEKTRSWWRATSSERELTRMGLLKRGQWIVINNGKAQEEVDAVSWFGSTEYEVGYRDRLRRRMLLQDVLSFGFFLGLGAENGRCQVYNFYVMQPEDLRFEDITALPDAEAIALDDNDVLFKIRDSWFESQETEAAIMDTNVNTDPGSEAIYEGHLVHVVKTDRSNAIIEHDDGERLTVTLDKLEPGRRTHSNSWVYGDGYRDNGFLADGAARIFSGQWVWVDAQPDIAKSLGCAVELACVWKIGPEGLHVFRTLDGTHDAVDEFAPVTDELNDYLNKDWNFGLFKDKAVTAGDTERFRMSQHPEDALTCIGKTHDTQIKLQKVDLQNYVAVEPRISEDQPPTYDEAIRDMADAREDFYNKTGIQRKGGRGATIEEGAAGDDDAPTEEDEKKTEMLPFIIGGVVLILAYNFIK